MKKKGLIISTVVMAVVLIASLTTATYAWFSANAAVSVSNMTLTTKAADGLQISVYNATDDVNYSGEISISGGENIVATQGTIQGSVADWGEELTFGEITATPDASTRLSFTTADVSNLVADTCYYTESGGIYTLYARTNAAKVPTFIGEGVEAFAEGTYYTATEGTGTDGSDMYVPTAYDTDQNPLGFKKATNLSNYFYLPIQIRATSKVKQIFYRIKLTQESGTMNANYAPGMGAATYISIVPTASVTGSTVPSNGYKPFSDAHISGTKMVNGSGGAFTTSDAYSMDGFILSSETATEAFVPYNFYILVWIEGYDNECVNKTAGSGLNISIEFGYTKDGEANRTIESGVISGTNPFSEGSTAGNIHEIVA